MQAAYKIDLLLVNGNADPKVADSYSIAILGPSQLLYIQRTERIGVFHCFNCDFDAGSKVGRFDVLHVPRETLTKRALHGLASRMRNTSLRETRFERCPSRMASRIA